MTNDKLIARLEAADASEQAEFLLLTFKTLNPVSMCWDFDQGQAYEEKLTRFLAMLDAEAYESAALTLVPEGYFPVIDFVLNRAWIRTSDGKDHPNIAQCNQPQATPALAIVIAALKAKEADNGR